VGFTRLVDAARKTRKVSMATSESIGGEKPRRGG
jgi:hypothetical protein